ncbi:putative inorganic polyphosphate/ATP-NAD kinase [Halolamina pelagica]|uniref:Putative inorganic polyphosphate/ATP-NAD kinase n=1 Tax=Halolamina pelagica TaxID=699431 RepID=A0A0P7GPF7_9EURY|nr:NAD(+)/NADH kinase [Halolamina pelagica]KPN30831.1 putative inorganic polyphosphate/ATP-NAD kinase [Halolamina pelagica]
MTQSTPISRVSLRGADADLAPLSLDDDDPDAVVAVGADAVEAAALADADRPILAVDADDGRHGTTRDRLADAAAALAAGSYRRVSHPVIGVAVEGERVGRAVFDATLMTSEPARISEYALVATAERLFDVRADGVVVSTPLGSAGYGRAAGGPIVAPGGGLSVVPVAPFSTRASPWVVPGPLSLQVERDEGAVSLFLDGEQRRQLGPAEPVEISVVDEFTCLRPLVAGSPELEKH